MTFLKRKFKDLQNEPPYNYSKFNCYLVLLRTKNRQLKSLEASEMALVVFIADRRPWIFTCGDMLSVDLFWITPILCLG